MGKTVLQSLLNIVFLAAILALGYLQFENQERQRALQRQIEALGVSQQDQQAQLEQLNQQSLGKAVNQANEAIAQGLDKFMGIMEEEIRAAREALKKEKPRSDGTAEQP